VNFYLLNWPDDLDRAAYAHATDQIESCEVCGTCGRNWFRQIKDLDVELYGVDINGFVWTLGAQLVVTNSLLNDLRAAGISGFSPRPASISYISEGRGGPSLLEQDSCFEPPLIWQLELLTDCRTPPNDFAEFQVCPVCSQCNFVDWEPPRLTVDTRRWIGVDVFTHHHIDVIITQRFLDVVTKARVHNYKITPLEVR